MSDEFAEHLSRQTVAQTAIALGSATAEQEVVEAFSDALREYIKRVGEAMKSLYEHAGRTQPTFLDAVAAIQAVDPAPVSWKTLQRFAFGNLKDEAGNLGETWEQPFVFDVPAFPLRKRARHSYGPEGSTTADGAKKPAAARNPLEMPPPPLPPFPDKRTYEDPSKKPRQKSSGDAKAVMAERRRRNRLVRTHLVRIVQTEDMESRESSLMNGHGLVNGDAAGHKRKGVASEVPLPKPLLEKPALHPLSLDGVDMATVPEHKLFDPVFRGGGGLTTEEKLLFGATYEQKGNEKEKKKA